MQLKREAKLLTVIGLNTKHADCITKNRPFSETKSFRRISFCRSQFRNDIKYFLTDETTFMHCLEYVDFVDFFLNPFKLKRGHMMDMP